MHQGLVAFDRKSLVLATFGAYPGMADDIIHSRGLAHLGGVHMLVQVTVLQGEPVTGQRCYGVPVRIPYKKDAKLALSRRIPAHQY